MTRKRTGRCRSKQPRSSDDRRAAESAAKALQQETDRRRESAITNVNRKRAQIVFGTNGADLAESDRESERICKFNPDAIYRAFTSGFAGITLQYMNVLHERDTSNVRGNSQLFIEDFEKRMNASDPVERLLIEQLLLTHYRSLILSRKAAAATHAVVDTITAGLATVLNQQCDQVTNTVRKLILALGEYRAPAQTFAPNINAAHQQIVNQHFRSDRKK